MIDQSAWVDLHDIADQATGCRSFPQAHWYWKVDADPAIQDGVLRHDWQNIDYVVVTNQLLSDIHAKENAGKFPLVTQALRHSTHLITFDTGGWPIEVRQVQHLSHRHDIH